MIVTMDYATLSPKIVLLKDMQVQRVAQDLIGFFTRVCLPQEIPLDKDVSFTSSLLQ